MAVLHEEKITEVKINNNGDGKITTKKQAYEFVSSLSDPSKMPGRGWGISPSKCKRGAVLHKTNPDSICKHCYAMKGRYAFPNVMESHEKRLDKYYNEPRWKEAMIFLIKSEKYFRWFDSGDLQSVKMLKDIIEICYATPDTNHWMSTRESGIILTYKMIHENKLPFPKNLCIRISNDEIDKAPPCKIDGCHNSMTVSKNYKDSFNKQCPVSFNEDISSCDEAGCYSCWNNNVDLILYKLH